uniref:Uncharacterized protein n=1 Tax=Tanacetum cinerariifolium TaxID=118510 RepID=A0A6L2L4D5_TANCI|nr:hypothetical protein [Tanacetum cinerariifolium]
MHNGNSIMNKVIFNKFLEFYNDDFDPFVSFSCSFVSSNQESQQLLETCATLTKKVGNLEQDKIAQAIEITKLKQRVRRLEKKRKLKVSRFKRLRKVGTDQRVESSADTGRFPESQAQVYHLDLKHAQKVLSMQKTDEAEPAEVEEIIEVVIAAKLMIEVVTTVADATTTDATTINVTPVAKAKVKSKDKGKGILVEEPKPLKRQAQIEQDETFARELEAELNANINWNDVIEQMKRKERQDNTDIEEEESKESKRKSESSKQKAAKIQRIDKEVDELKTHLQIVPNDEDDVYTKVTPLSLKVPIVDYQIHHEHNKPYYKIIRADGTHQLFLSFISLLRNFDREDLEML